MTAETNKEEAEQLVLATPKVQSYLMSRDIFFRIVSEIFRILDGLANPDLTEAVLIAQ